MSGAPSFGDPRAFWRSVGAGEFLARVARDRVVFSPESAETERIR